jgi:lysine 6-dehydrogenase
MRVKTVGFNKDVKCTTEINIVEKYDSESGFLAMEKWTGWHASIVMIEILKGNIPNGAHPIEKAMTGKTFHEQALARSYNIKIVKK